MSSTNGNDTIIGTDFSDLLDGLAGNDIIDGRIGSDTLYGGPGLDTIYGGDGNDTIYGENTSSNVSGGDRDTIYGESGNDYLVGGAGNDSVWGGDGFDIIYGDYEMSTATGGADSLFGEDGDDFISGGAGDDVISGSSGSDTLFGGDGNDTIYADRFFDDRFNIDSIRGGEGNDIIYTNASNRNFNMYFGDNGIDTILVTNINIWFRNFDMINSIEFIRSDESRPPAKILGAMQQGNILDFSATIFLNVESIYGDEGLDYFTDFSNDTIIGTVQDDSIFGEGGNDSLVGGSGNDTISGGADSATPYQNNPDDGADTIAGGAGSDTALYWQLRSAMTVAGTSASFTITIGGVTDVLQDIEFVRIGGADYSFTELESGVILGTENADNLGGSSGADTINGRGGNDFLKGEAGNDTLDGGNGNDTLDGGAGDDNLYGGAGADRFIGGDGIDIVRYDASAVGVAVDLLFSNAYNGEAAGDTFASVEGASGSNFADGFWGTLGSDTFFTWLGNDYVDGRDGVDVLLMGGGADTLVGGAGGDYLAGEAGADVFRLLAFTDSTAAAQDWLVDFSSAEGDRIDLSALTGGHATFNAGFGTGTSVYAFTQGAVSLVQVYTGQTLKSQLLVNQAVLTQGDFIL